jgi:hypothetical protein
MGRSCNVSGGKTSRWLLACLALCVGASTSCGNPSAIERSLPKVTCPRKVDVPPEMVAAGTTTAFGEIHGTREAPEFFGDVVCNVATGRQHILVGLEQPSSEAGAIHAFLAGDDHALDGRAFWTQPFQSGRTSVAMLALLSELRRIIKMNPRVELFLFDISDGVDTQGRDSKMADAIFSKRASDRDAVILTFVGNLHAQKTKGVPWDPALEPMAYQLVHRGLRLVSLNIRNPDGTAWICRTNDASSCGSAKIGGEKPSPDAFPRGIRLSGATSADGYDGVYTVSSATASPPAMPVHR